MKFKENCRGGIAKYETEFDIKLEGGYLKAHYYAKNSKMFSYSNIYNDDIYNGDVCEIFLDMGVSNHYYEIEVAPNGTIFLADITNDGVSFTGDRLKENFINAKVIVHENDYEVYIEVPLEKLGYNPKLGIKYNAYRIETEGGTPNANLFALNPTMCGSFHKKESFIKL